MSWSGFLSMIDSAWAQPRADRSTRKRPEITDTVAPEAVPPGHRHADHLRAEGGHPSPGDGINAEGFGIGSGRGPGRRSPVVLGGEPSLEQLADGQEWCGPPDRAVPGELGGQFTPALLGVDSCAVEPERALHGAAGHRVDADGDADLEDAWRPLPQ